MLFFLLVVFTTETNTSKIENDKSTFCKTLNCDHNLKNKICGIRPEKDGYRLRLFENECQLLKYGCQVENNYGKKFNILVNTTA